MEVDGFKNERTLPCQRQLGYPSEEFRLFVLNGKVSWVFATRIGDLGRPVLRTAEFPVALRTPLQATIGMRNVEDGVTRNLFDPWKKLLERIPSKTPYVLPGVEINLLRNVLDSGPEKKAMGAVLPYECLHTRLRLFEQRLDHGRAGLLVPNLDSLIVRMPWWTTHHASDFFIARWNPAKKLWARYPGVTHFHLRWLQTTRRVVRDRKLKGIDGSRASVSRAQAHSRTSSPTA